MNKLIGPFTILVSILLAFTPISNSESKIEEEEAIMSSEIPCWSQLKPRDDYKTTHCPGCSAEDDYVRDGGEGECVSSPVIEE